MSHLLARPVRRRRNDARDRTRRDRGLSGRDLRDRRLVAFVRLPAKQCRAPRGSALGQQTPLAKLTAATVGAPAPRLVSPEIDEHGLVNVPASLYLFSFEGRPRRLVTTLFEDPVVAHARRGIDAAAGGDDVFHMWLHPNNLTGRPEIARLRAIFDYLDDRRNDVRIETMGEVATRVRDEQGSTPAPVTRSTE